MYNAFNRPRPVAWIFFLLGFGLCLVAGTWQVERLAWKEGLIAQIATANEQAPLIRLPKDVHALEALQFREVRLSGTWQGVTEFHLTPRYWRNQFGYWVITPLRLADGRTVLINRGWVPREKKLAETRPETRARGTVSLAGMVRVGAERSPFTPQNQPEKNIWFGRDIKQMAAFAKLSNVVPVMVDVIGEQDIRHLPIPSDGIIRLRNDHLSYILTWYGISAGILLIFIVYHRKKQ